MENGRLDHALKWCEKKKRGSPDWIIFDRQNKKEKARENRKQWRKNNPEKWKEQKRRYYKNNPEKIREQNDKWRKNNPEKIRKINKRYFKKIRKTNPKYNLKQKISWAIRMSLKGKKAGRRWEDLVGYTLNDLLKRLKNTMPAGYTWKDYLKGKLHIDHIIPISAFNFTRPEHTDFKRCWALSNLRLLPAKENFIKHSKLAKPFQPALKI